MLIADRNLLGKIIAENVTESAELVLLKEKLYNLVENFTQDENIIDRFDELFSSILKIAQIDSKYDGFIAGAEFAKNEL